MALTCLCESPWICKALAHCENQWERWCRNYCCSSSIGSCNRWSLGLIQHAQRAASLKHLVYVNKFTHQSLYFTELNGEEECPIRS